MGSCQGPAREREPVPSARRIKHNLAIILVSTFHIRRQGRREKPAETYNKDSKSLRLSFAGTDFIIFARTMTGGVKGQQTRTLQMKRGAVGVCGSLVWPPTSHPYCPERTQRLLSNSSGQRFGQTRQATAAAVEGLNLAEAAATDQSGDKETDGDCLSSRNNFLQNIERKKIDLFFFWPFLQRCSLW